MRPPIEERHHKYYSEDTEQRKGYFDKQFLRLAKEYAKNNKITLSGFFSSIRDLESFKSAVSIVWEEDPSLLSYFEGMNESEKIEFFGRNAIQNIVTKTEEGKDPTPKNIPSEVKQVKKKTINYYDGEVKGKKVLVRKFFIKDKRTNKKRAIYRDSKGRFAKRIS